MSRGLKFEKTTMKSRKQSAPTLQMTVKWIAKLGGFLARKGDKQPGITHVWRGINSPGQTDGFCFYS
jgi:hypothetical protein